MEAVLLGLAGWLEMAGVSAWARGDPLAYPWANAFHLLGLVMLVGGIGVVDLRIAGLWRALPLDALEHALTPVALAGIGVLAVSGTILFAADGRALAGSGMFQLKLVLVALALANAAAFRFVRRRGWPGEPPLLARGMAVLSLGLWLAVGTAGRMIAYS